MMGKIPLGIIVLTGILFLSISEGIGQRDTHLLRQVEVKDCYAVQIIYDNKIDFDSASFDVYNSLDAGEFLNQNSGVYIKDYAPGSTSTLSYRGNSANHTKILWEGMSVDNAQLGLTDLSLMNLGSQVQAEFAKGAYSMQQSSGGFGGILNVQQIPNSLDQPFTLRTGIQYGSFNTKSIPLDFTITSKKQKVSFASSLYYTSSDNNYSYVPNPASKTKESRENAAYERIQWMPYLLYKPNDRHALKLSYWYMESQRGVPSAVGVSHGEAKQLDNWNRAKLVYAFSKSKMKVFLKSMVSEDYMRYENPGINVDSRNNVRSFKNMGEVFYTVSTNWFGESHLRYDIQEVETNNYEELKQQDIISFYQSIRHQRARTFFKALVRIESFNGNDPVLLPALNIGYRPNDNPYLWLYANVGRNMRYPTFNEQFWVNAGNPDLENEESISAELSLDHKFIHRKRFRNWNYRYIATIFYSDVTNLIYWSPGNNGIWSPQNIKSVVNQGFDLENEFSLRKGNWNHNINLGYAFVDSRIQEDHDYPENQGNQQVYIPNHKIHGALNIEYKKLYFLRYSQAYTGKVFISPDNSEYLPYSAPAKVEVGRKFRFKKSRAVLSFRINNLFNEEYQYVVNMPMPLQNYTINLLYHIN